MHDSVIGIMHFLLVYWATCQWNFFRICYKAFGNIYFMHFRVIGKFENTIIKICADFLEEYTYQ